MLQPTWNLLRDKLSNLSSSQIFELHVKVSCFLDIHAANKKAPTATTKEHHLEAIDELATELEKILR